MPFNQTKPQTPTPTPMDVAGTVHQAVDIAFSIADLLGSLFSEAKPRKRALTISNNGSVVTLSLNQQSQPQFTTEGPATTMGVVTATTSTIAGQGQTGVPLAAQTFYIPGGAGPTLFSQFPNYTSGLLTATLVDTSENSIVPVGALTARNFTASNDVQITNYVYFDITGTEIRLINTDTSNGYSVIFTLTTAAPTRTFTVSGSVPQNGSALINLPENISSTTFAQLTAIVWGPSASLSGI